MPDDKRVPLTKICSLGGAREADLTLYDGVITIEDSTIQDPFRIEAVDPPQHRRQAYRGQCEKGMGTNRTEVSSFSGLSYG